MSDWRSRAQTVQVEQVDPLTASRNAIEQRKRDIAADPNNVPPVDQTPYTVEVSRPTEQPTQDWRSRATSISSEEAGFSGRVKNIVTDNLGQMEDSARAYVEGEQSMLETGAQQALSFASIPVDVAMEGVSTITPQPVKDAVSAVGSAVGSLPTIGGMGEGTIGGSLPSELSQIAEDHPRLARNTQAVMDAASLVPAAKVASGAATGVGKASTKLATRPTKAIPKTATDLKSMAHEAYRQADELGANYTPKDVADPFTKALDDVIPSPIAGKVLTSEDQLLSKHLSEYQGLKSQPLTLQDVQRLDESLTQKITASFLDTQTGLPNSSGRKLMQLQEKLRNIVDEVPDNAANDALVNGRRLWKAQTILNDLDTIAERASMTQNVSTSLRTGYKNLYMNKKRIRGWPEEAKELLKKAATPSVTDDALQLISSRLPAIIMGGTGNIGGAATAHMVGAAGRGAAAKVGATRGAKIQQSVVDDAVGGLRAVNPTPDIPLMLSAPSN